MIWAFKADLQGFELFIRQVNSGLDKLPISFCVRYSSPKFATLLSEADKPPIVFC